MSATLPVPSKGALRVLRNLALGTSCTVAVGAAILTEDRRRRICALREVHDNATKLKSSRSYHSDGAAVVELFEENALKGFGLIHTKSQAPAKSPPPLPLSAYDVPNSNRSSEFPEHRKHAPRSLNAKHCPDGYSQAFRDQEEVKDSEKTRKLDLPSRPVDSRDVRIPRGVSDRSGLLTEWERCRQHGALLPQEIPVGLETEIDDRQGRLTLDIVTLLDSAASLRGFGKHHALDAAATRFTETFLDGLDIRQIGAPLLSAAIRLSQDCVSKDRFQAALKILETFTSHPVDENVYYELSPGPIIQYLIKNPIMKTKANDPTIATQMRQDLQRAIRLFLVNFTNKPLSMPPQMVTLGQALCEASCNYGLYHLTDKIYHRIMVGRMEEFNGAFKYLVIAAHEQGDHISTFKYFQKYSSNPLLDEREFSDIFKRAASSVLNLGDINKVEKFLNLSQATTSSRAWKMPTTTLLQLLGHHWRSGHDLERTRGLFDSLETSVHWSERPEALYAAIIQFCVEAGSEAKASEYHDKLMRLFPDSLPNVRISGHFALAKAMRDDWNGVQSDFEKISGYSTDPTDSKTCSEIFVPILKLFATKHQIKDTEQFLQYFVDHFNIKLNLYMSNIMVDAYAKAGDTDSLSKWIQYAVSNGCPFDSVSFNIILNNCHNRWKFTFDDLNQLFKYVRQNLSGYAEGLINSDTVLMMRRIAVTEHAGNAPALASITAHLGLQPEGTHAFDCRRLQQKMTEAFAANEPEKVLVLYKEAFIHQDVRTDPELLATAVQASLWIHGSDVSPAMGLLEQAKQYGCKDMKAGIVSIFMHELSRVGAKDLVESTSTFVFREIKDRGIPIPIHVVTHTVNILVKTHRYEEALEFWNSICSSLVDPSSVNLPTLTVLLSAHIGLRHSRGVEWVLDAVVTKDITPDKQFILNLKNARRGIAKKIKVAMMHGENPGYDILTFRSTLEKSLQQALAIRAATRVQKLDVKQKMINIIEKAIEDQRLMSKVAPYESCDHALHAQYTVT
ncbi:hypothetical protein F5884DRAFT_803263 [Xylogone sp. PMI_703]|nr:hypothetical protein F5884DRAFT_803263 [Xylogone sp. PMI_703]